MTPTLPRPLHRLAVGLVGGLVVVAGLVMVPLPGPGWLVVASGTGLLSREFAWAAAPARRLQGAIDEVLRAADRVRGGRLLLLVLTVGLSVLPLLPR